MTGVGTELKKFFAWFGFEGGSGCGCELRQLKYDTLGIEWCEKHKAEIVEEILSEAKQRNIALPDYATRFVLAGIVGICINRAKNR